MQKGRGWLAAAQYNHGIVMRGLGCRIYRQRGGQAEDTLPSEVTHMAGYPCVLREFTFGEQVAQGPGPGEKNYRETSFRPAGAPEVLQESEEPVDAIIKGKSDKKPFLGPCRDRGVCRAGRGANSRAETLSLFGGLPGLGKDNQREEGGRWPPADGERSFGMFAGRSIQRRRVGCHHLCLSPNVTSFVPSREWAVMGLGWAPNPATELLWTWEEAEEQQDRAWWDSSGFPSGPQFPHSNMEREENAQPPRATEKQGHISGHKT